MYLLLQHRVFLLVLKYKMPFGKWATAYSHLGKGLTRIAEKTAFGRSLN